ncbi:MAG: hypothetical protein U0177_20750 [Kouleothrix sp.]
MVAHPLAALAQDPEQHRVALRVRLEPALAVRLHTIRNVPAAPLALLSTVAVALVGALACLVALPLGQHALDTALELAVLRGLLLRLTAVDHLDLEDGHVRLELAALHVVAVAAVDRLDPHAVELVPARGGEKLLKLLAFGSAGARAGLVDELCHH